MSLNEALVEQAVLDWFTHLGYTVLYGPNIAPGEAEAERASYSDVVLQDRLRAAIARLNPHIPDETVEEVLRKVVLADNPNLIEQNRTIHSLLINGVPVE
jgi:type I restriction enzyme R subunit